MGIELRVDSPVLMGEELSFKLNRTVVVIIERIRGFFYMNLTPTCYKIAARHLYTKAQHLSR